MGDYCGTEHMPGSRFPRCHQERARVAADPQPKKPCLIHPCGLGDPRFCERRRRRSPGAYGAVHIVGNPPPHAAGKRRGLERQARQTGRSSRAGIPAEASTDRAVLGLTAVACGFQDMGCSDPGPCRMYGPVTFRTPVKWWGVGDGGCAGWAATQRALIQL
jgi:hypothetical protein